MKKPVLLFLVCSVISSGSFASGHIQGFKDPLLKTFITQSGKRPDVKFQQELRSGAAWMSYIQKHPGWWVQFNEENRKPARAVGNPVMIPASGTPEVRAMSFIQNELQDFGVPVSNLVLRRSAETAKHQYVTYYQEYQGLEVLWSEVSVKMLKSNGGVIVFGLNCFENISLVTWPAIPPAAAIAAASDQVGGIISVTVNPELKILPVPGNRNYAFHLVYEITVNNKDEEQVPGKYYTLVDAMNGEVLYRTNQVAHFANTDITLTATITPTNPYQPNAVLPVKNAGIVQQSNLYFTDATGFAGLPNTVPVSVTISLEGMYSKIETNGTTPTFTTMVNPGSNTISFDAHSNIRELSAYNSVNDIHNYLNSKVPSFTSLDFPMVTNIDVAGTCNAFYDGDINFFDQGGGCGATSLINDVVYHEYGHAINDLLYQFYGGSFGNGAMGEGYADTWANGLTNDPVLGIGFFLNDPTGYVRRYDQSPKVYPQDLVGEVHADGEIIAGAWWDYGININDRQLAMDLFAETFAATISGPDGSEGQLYTDILIEAITDDDNDGNLNNGTPHLSQLLSAFARHGITLLTNVTFTHNEVLSGTDLSPVIINATFAYTSQFPWFTATAQGFYKVNGLGAWTPFTMSYVSGNSYTGSIPGQPAGSLVSYYLAIVDGGGGVLQTLPAGAADPDPNIPYYVMIDFTPLVTDDMEGTLAGWTAGLPTDGAVTGQWLFDTPVGSFNNGVICQTDYQHTPGGIICAITGNASPNDPIGTNDIDSGRTTLISPTFDLSTSINPGFSYYRWYTNDQGSNPKTDAWQVSISGDGVNWVPVEVTRTPDHSWRRFAFRVKDYIATSATVSVRFVAEDSAANKGSLVEGALDDFVLYDATTTGVENPSPDILSLVVYPLPAMNDLNLSWTMNRDDRLTLYLINSLGETVYSTTENYYSKGTHQVTLDCAGLDAGVYLLKLNGQHTVALRKFSIFK